MKRFKNICVGKLYGNVSVGKGTIIHPEAVIRAEAGPIIIGDDNLIEEQVVIVNKIVKGKEPRTMTIGNGNTFEVGCYVESSKIGNNNIIESKARVGKNIELTNGCVIGALCEVMCKEVIPENTVIFGSGCERTVWRDGPVTAHRNPQLDLLSVILPNFHHVREV